MALFPFVSNADKFKTETRVKKFLSKEDNMVSVIVETNVFSDEDIDADDYIDKFYGYERIDDIEEEEDTGTVNERKIIDQRKAELLNDPEFQKLKRKMENPSSADTMEGCLILVVLVIVIFFLFKMCS